MKRGWKRARREVETSEREKESEDWRIESEREKESEDWRIESEREGILVYSGLCFFSVSGFYCFALKQ